MEIVETGALRRVDAERTEDVAVVQLFQGIYGVGMRFLLYPRLG
jgi:DNA polymerase lambda